MDLFRSLQRRKVGWRSVELNIRRSNLLEDSFTQCHSQYRGKGILGRLEVTYVDEDGYDAGGLTRHWFTSVVRELFNPNYGLFIPTENGRSFVANRSSMFVNQNALGYFEFAGQVIARALIDNCQVDAHLSHGLLKQLLGRPNTLRDIQDISVDVYDSLLWVLQNDPEDAELTFVHECDLFGKMETVELKPNGRNIFVTVDNRDTYVQCVVNQILKEQASEQTKAFSKGFYDIIPVDEMKMFRPDELDLLICGVPEIDVDDLLASCEFQLPYYIDHPVIQRFIEVLRSFSNTQKAQFLLYVTGSSQMPVGGLRNLATRAPLKIIGGPPPSHLPISHTCYHQLELPAYQDAETLKSKLVLAMTEGTTFGLT
jgi:E3 ubiquitin-protein ligase HUWE1